MFAETRNPKLETRNPEANARALNRTNEILQMFAAVQMQESGKDVSSPEVQALTHLPP